MIIDLILAAALVMAVIKGYSRGLIIAVFSLLAFIVGLAAALKLSAVVAGWLGQNVNISKQWLPVLSFALVFLAVVLLVNKGARMVEKTVKWALLGWVNKLGGVVFFVVLYLIIFSIGIFYAEQLGLITPEMIKSSQTYAFVKPWAPKVINGLGAVIPLFRDLFTQLQEFFGKVAVNAAAA
jgi:membrane protein required for colicin V production